MPTRPWKVLTAAALIGIAGDVLMRESELRLGFTLWLFTLIASVLVIGGMRDREQNLLLAGIALAACGVSLRDAPLLHTINLMSVFCMGALLIRYGTGAALGRLQLVDVPRVGVLALVNTLLGTPRIMGGSGAATGHATGSSGRRSQTVRALLLGIALAVPPLAIVTALLSSSDPVFEALLQRVFATEALSHVLLAVVLAWIAAGWIQAALRSAVGCWIPELRTPALPFAAVSVALIALIVLLGAFVITQARVLFGGEAFLLSTQQLSLATYARRGFFEMIVATGVVLTTLVVTEWLLPPDAIDAHRHYRRLAAALLVLVSAVLVSAATRIGLYVHRFGLTLDRTLAIAVIIWVVAALALFSWSVLRRRADRFFPALIAVTVVWVALFNMLNPEALVARVNLARAAGGNTFDAAYHATLSADALPVLLDGAPRLASAECQQLQTTMAAQRARRLAAASVPHEWRQMNLAAVRAARWYEETGSLGCR